MDLENLRQQIDKIDATLVMLLAQRLKLAEKTAGLKPQVIDKRREQTVLAQVRRFSKKRLRADFTEQIFRLIIEESRKVQEQREGETN